MNSTHWIHDALARHEGPLVLYARRIVGDDERARDVVQECFLKLCREERAAVEPHLAEWLYTVCRNAALDARRREQKMGSWNDAEAAARAGREGDPAVGLEERDEGSRALALLAGLPAKQQEALRLKFQGGLSYGEIAGVTKQPIGTVGWLIHEGLKALRQKMAGDVLKEGVA